MHSRSDDNLSSQLFTSTYPPNEFSTTSIIDDDLTPRLVVETMHTTEPQLEPISTDEEDTNQFTEKSNSPTHTISSSNGHDTVSDCFRTC